MSNLNRISATLSDADITEIEGHLAAIRAKMPFLITLTAKERRAKSKLGEKSMGFEEKCETYMLSNPQFMPGFIGLEEVDKDRTLRTQLLHLSAQHQALSATIQDTLMLTGSDLWSSDLAYYQSVQEAARRGLPGAEAIYNDLKSRFPGTAHPAAPVPADKPTDPS